MFECKYCCYCNTCELFCLLSPRLPRDKTSNSTRFGVHSRTQHSLIVLACCLPCLRRHMPPPLSLPRVPVMGATTSSNAFCLVTKRFILCFWLHCSSRQAFLCLTFGHFIIFMCICSQQGIPWYYQAPVGTYRLGAGQHNSPWGIVGSQDTAHPSSYSFYWSYELFLTTLTDRRTMSPLHICRRTRL